MPLNQTQSAAFEIEQLKKTPSRRMQSQTLRTPEVKQPAQADGISRVVTDQTQKSTTPASNDSLISRISKLRPMQPASNDPQYNADHSREDIKTNQLFQQQAEEQELRNYEIQQDREQITYQNRVHRKNIAIQIKIDAINSVSYLPYWIMIFVEIFRFPLGFIELVPIVGYAFVLVISFLVMISNTILLLFAHMRDPVKDKSTISLRISAMLGVWFMAATLPYIKMLIPITLMTAVAIYLSVRKSHRKEVARLERKIVRTA